MVDEPFRTLRAQGYQIVGRHSGVKTCHWVRKALTEGKICYKGKFYGIETHRCLQMSPALVYCTNRCVYCWRPLPGERGFEWAGGRIPAEDEPKEIVDGAIEAHRRALSGYKGNPKVPEAKYEEAIRPRHVAISLSGEPTLYSKLSELIEEFHRRGMTTFLVTNGTNPRALEGLREPTQLYVSVSAPSEEVYKRVCRPTTNGSWEALMRTLSMLRSFSCPTVVRITLVKGLNMEDPDGYARILNMGNPTYVEVKAYMHVGSSIWRLGAEAMPNHEEVVEFAGELAKRSGYDLVDDVSASRVALLSRVSKRGQVCEDRRDNIRDKQDA
ncbi:MAG: 4-demethylwyosine synthase TYW1 [Candidatus Methanomethylicaceae archaeon]|nr:4-demethylwyosine synthase TYW1 [Candidatus Verstraetearchaeota archaeon]